ncbi:hypothetical protein [Winogradskyella aurantiaca]|uniref:hypothetical protein n=1 Tax=Winogradskyella aurantiaca TaxID=2219558 RepID=UPI000E1D98A9|nr:hypothetical protein [Winogradskyella aurantiaca]
MKQLIFRCLILSSISLGISPIFGQSKGLEGFNNLIGKTWKASGQWSNGTKFEQEVHFSFDLCKQIVLAETIGYIDDKQQELGKRNHGVRLYNASTEKLEFWEFDRFGGVTNGQLMVDGNTIYYFYSYGGTDLTDCWEYIDANTYKFTVGVYNNCNWKKTYLVTEFKQKTAQ